MHTAMLLTHCTWSLLQHSACEELLVVLCCLQESLLLTANALPRLVQCQLAS
jgi:hypothetical protein